MSHMQAVYKSNVTSVGHTIFKRSLDINTHNSSMIGMRQLGCISIMDFNSDIVFYVQNGWFIILLIM